MTGWCRSRTTRRDRRPGLARLGPSAAGPQRTRARRCSGWSARGRDRPYFRKPCGPARGRRVPPSAAAHEPLHDRTSHAKLPGTVPNTCGRRSSQPPAVTAAQIQQVPRILQSASAYIGAALAPALSPSVTVRDDADPIRVAAACCWRPSDGRQQSCAPTSRDREPQHDLGQHADFLGKGCGSRRSPPGDLRAALLRVVHQHLLQPGGDLAGRLRPWRAGQRPGGEPVRARRDRHRAQEPRDRAAPRPGSATASSSPPTSIWCSRPSRRPTTDRPAAC